MGLRCAVLLTLIWSMASPLRNWPLKDLLSLRVDFILDLKNTRHLYIVRVRDRRVVRTECKSIVEGQKHLKKKERRSFRDFLNSWDLELIAFDIA